MKLDQNYLSDEEGVLFNKYKTTVIQYPLGNSRKEYTIPDSVTKIGEDAFAYCLALTSITISNSVTTIGGYAFAPCNLSQLTITNSVTSIGEYAFEACNKLTDIYFTGTEEEWNAIDKSSAKIPSSVTIHYNYVPSNS